MINKKKYSLQLIRAVERLNKKVIKFVESNNDILEYSLNDAFELIVKDKSKTSDFQFSITNPTQDQRNNNINFQIEFNPQNSADIKPRRFSSVESGIYNTLEAWTNNIRAYNSIQLTPEDNLLNEYEKEFFENFEILDEDADTHPYELEKQVIIHNYFVKVIEVLGENKEENKELIEEAENIRDNVPNMTKRSTVRRISGFLAKVRKKSLPLLKKIMELGGAQVFKRTLDYIIDNIGNWITLLNP